MSLRTEISILRGFFTPEEAAAWKLNSGTGGGETGRLSGSRGFKRVNIVHNSAVNNAENQRKVNVIGDETNALGNPTHYGPFG